MERKYLFEAGLGVYTSYKTILPIEYLKDLEKKDKHKYHIYAILAFPKVYFEPEKTYVGKDGIYMSIFNPTYGKRYSIPKFSMGNVDYSKVVMEHKYPYEKMVVSIKDEAFLKEHPEIIVPDPTMTAQDMFNLYSQYGLEEKREFEVLYIGQAYGRDGDRTAFTRLSAHSTLQKILTDCQSKYTDKHIYIMLMEFTHQLNMTLDGISGRYTKSEADNQKHMKEVLSNLPEEQQIINITEAALINYFKPEYNVNFVENFPDENHKGYKQYFDLDYNSLVVDVDLEFDDSSLIQLYSSENRINSSYDYIQYNLYNDNNRLNMYDIFRKE